MTWSKFGAEYPAEARGLSDAAWRLLGECVMYANHLQTDLVLSRVDVERGTWVQAPLDPLIVELVEAGWWERLPDGRFFVFARFPGWQRSKAQVEAKRATDRAAQARKRARMSASSDDSCAESVAESSRFSERNGTGQALEGEHTLTVVRDETRDGAAVLSWPAVRQPGGGSA